MRAAADILVVGAGPAGLALALQAHDHGAAVRVVDRRPEADRPGDGPGGARAVLRSPATTEQALFGFVAGCDGPASTVRAQVGNRVARADVPRGSRAGGRRAGWRSRQ